MTNVSQPLRRPRRSSKCLDAAEKSPLNDNLMVGSIDVTTSSQQILNLDNISPLNSDLNLRRRSVCHIPLPSNMRMDFNGFKAMDLVDKKASNQSNGNGLVRINGRIEPTWENTLEKAVKSIVSIRANHVRPFDTESSGSYSATGFIVDAVNGIILSNRHVVSPAPIVAQGILFNYEEVDLVPIYRDPVHDFGFLKFDVEKVKFMELVETKLSPKRAKVGLDIRVVGNNAGEKLSILAGTLARLDRRAPDYGTGEYNDFNTFYLQAASGTSGGSSGSPVLDIEGHAIALNAGGSNKASSSYYLPLDRIKRALKYVQQGSKVPRGTLQTEFEHLAYDEVRRLGLPPSIEREVRNIFPEGTGMLVANQILPKGPGDKVLNPGDIILKMNNHPINSFLGLFEYIDDLVDQFIEIEVCRGRRIKTVHAKVQNLHSITPDRFVEIGGGVVNELSYQLAKSYSLPIEGVYVASSGHMLGSAAAWRKSIIVAINHVPTPNLDEFIRACSLLPDGSRVPVRYFVLDKPNKEKVMIMHVDRHWNPFRIGIRNDLTGIWELKNLPAPPSIHSYLPSTAAIPPSGLNDGPGDKVLPSLVTIDFHIPYMVDGMKATQFYGCGLIVDKVRGLIVCDRDTIPISIGDIFITFASSIVIPGKLKYLHPIYNFVVLSYDPRLIGNTPVTSANLLFDENQLSQGDDVYFVGISADHNTIVKQTRVASSNTLGTRECTPPRWRAINIEGIRLDTTISSQGGVICNKQGGIYAMWVNYSYQDEKAREVSIMQGLSVGLLYTTLNPLMNGLSPNVNSLDVEFWTIRLSAARSLGLSDKWLKRIENSTTHRHTLLYVLSIISPKSPAASLLRSGDLILEANGRLLTSMSDVDPLYSLKTVDMTILRDGKELNLHLPTIPMKGTETDRLICWAGALIQEPSRAVMEQVKHIPNGVYVACTLYGSPVNTFNLKPGVFITHINDHPITDLEDFLKLVLELKPAQLLPSSGIQLDQSNSIIETDEIIPFPILSKQDKKKPQLLDLDLIEDDDEEIDYVRLTTQTRSNAIHVFTLKQDPIYWPTWELNLDPTAESGWKCTYY